MEIRPAEISEILKKQIASFDTEADVSETGQVLSVGDGIARIFGLQNVMAGELVSFPSAGLTGMAERRPAAELPPSDGGRLGGGRMSEPRDGDPDGDGDTVAADARRRGREGGWHRGTSGGEQPRCGGRSGSVGPGVQRGRSV